MPRRAGVEGTGSYGAGLTRFLRGEEIEVTEVNRPDRATVAGAARAIPSMPEPPHKPLSAAQFGFFVLLQ